MLGGWDSPLPRCRRERGVVVVVKWGMVWCTSPSPSVCGILVHYCSLFTSECNQSVSSSRLNQSLPHCANTSTHSSLISDQSVATVSCLLLRASLVWTLIIIICCRAKYAFLDKSPWQSLENMFPVVLFLSLILEHTIFMQWSLILRTLHLCNRAFACTVQQLGMQIIPLLVYIYFCSLFFSTNCCCLKMTDLVLLHISAEAATSESSPKSLATARAQNKSFKATGSHCYVLREPQM